MRNTGLSAFRNYRLHTWLKRCRDARTTTGATLMLSHRGLTSRTMLYRSLLLHGNGHAAPHHAHIADYYAVGHLWPMTCGVSVAPRYCTRSPQSTPVRPSVTRLACPHHFTSGPPSPLVSASPSIRARYQPDATDFFRGPVATAPGMAAAYIYLGSNNL